MKFQDFPTTFPPTGSVFGIYLYLLDVPIRSFAYSFSHSVITDYIHCHVLNTDLSPKLELLPNTIHFLFVTRKGTLHVVQAQQKRKSSSTSPQ